MDLKPLWDFLVSGISDSLGRDSGQFVIWIVCLFVFVALFILLYLVLKLFGLRATPSGTGTSFTADLLEAGTGSSKVAETQDPRAQFLDTLESAKQTGLEIYKFLTYLIVGALVAGGIFFASRATVANGLILVAVILFAVAFIVFSQMDSLRRMMTGQSEQAPPLDWTSNIKRTFTVGAPTVVKMDNDAIRKAQDLLKAGSDMDSVCREIDPDYGNWDSIQQQLFRTTLEAVLKSSGSER